MHTRDPDQPGKKVSVELHELAERFHQHRVSVAEVIEVLHERAYTLLIIIIALPFCVPVTPPGMSPPLGAVILIIATGFALGREPWLPARLLRLRLPPRFFGMVAEMASRILSLLERVLRPRWPKVTGSPRLVRLHAAMVAVAAGLLLIPAPIPLSNTLPAFGILLGTAGTMERDGLCVVLGYVFTFLGAAYFVLIALMGAQAWEFIVEKLAGAF
ncbi:MAG TPA: exopolysaccharide biosynthesis protein [Lacunisphaera sp.]|nr:exopolysaccharide biosynthesis protein [Lacunisphaera sp.]